jgi:hypothetical protein
MSRIQRYNCRKGAPSAAGSRASDSALEGAESGPTDSDARRAEFSIARDQDRVKMTALMHRLQWYNGRKCAT